MTLSNIILLCGRDNVFGNIVLDNRLDKALLIDRIEEECGNMASFWGDDTGAFIHYTESFFKRENDIISKTVDVLLLEYNPIENYDRMEEYTIKENGKRNGNNTRNNNSTRSAFNSVNQQPTGSETENGNYNDTDEKSTNNIGRVHGNVGVTTSQTMVEAEIRLRKYCIYDEIVKRYKANCFVGIFF